MRIPKCPNKSSYTIAPFSWTNVHKGMFHCVVNNCLVLSFFLSRSFLFIVSIQFIPFHVISSHFIHPTNQPSNQSINQSTDSLSVCLWSIHHHQWSWIMSHHHESPASAIRQPWLKKQPLPPYNWNAAAEVARSHRIQCAVCQRGDLRQ